MFLMLSFSSRSFCLATSDGNVTTKAIGYLRPQRRLCIFRKQHSFQPHYKLYDECGNGGFDCTVQNLHYYTIHPTSNTRWCVLTKTWPLVLLTRSGVSHLSVPKCYNRHGRLARIATAVCSWCFSFWRMTNIRAALLFVHHSQTWCHPAFPDWLPEL